MTLAARHDTGAICDEHPDTAISGELIRKRRYAGIPMVGVDDRPTLRRPRFTVWSDRMVEAALTIDLGVARRSARVLPAMQSAQVLLVEDNFVTQLITLQQLRALGCIPQTATTGADALELTRIADFDLILLDCLLPGIDGYETARAIRAFEQRAGRPRAIIVAITGDRDADCFEKCVSSGMDGHVAKPTTVDALRGIFERHL